MGTHICRNVGVWGVVCAVVLSVGTGAYALETFVIGGEEHPWKVSGRAPGGVIDFDTEPGWIRIQQIDPKDNIALGTYKRGGSVVSPNVFEDVKTQLEGIVSGDTTVAFERKSTEARFVNPLGVIVRVDLGARFGVNRLRFFPRHSPENPFQNDFMRAYEISLNDGTEATSLEGNPIFRIVKRVDQNDQWDVNLPIPLQYVRYIRIRSLTTINWEIDELEVYGTGFVPEAAYESHVRDFGDVATWGAIWWRQEKIGNPSKSQVIVRTRSGEDDTPMIYYRILGAKEEVEVEVSGREFAMLRLTERGSVQYFTQTGREISEAEYNALPEGQRGNIVYHRKVGAGGQAALDKDNVTPLTREQWEKLLPIEQGRVEPDLVHWSPWSPPYDYEEMLEKGSVPILSPAPRRYFQIRVDFKSEDLSAAAEVDSVGFVFSKPPVAHKILAEISPRRVKAGQVETFTYGVRPTMRGNDTGFDTFEIVTPTRAVGVDTIRVNGQNVAFTLDDPEEHRFVVHFPRIRTDQTLLEIVFRGTVLRYGTTFDGRASYSRPGPSGALDLPLKVLPGDATDYGEQDTNDLSVRIDLGGSLISALEISPNPFTPNGDGTHELTRISFNLLQLTRAMPLSVKIYSMAGTLVRGLVFEHRASGQYIDTWDGKDDGDELVRPGIYIVRIGVSTDSGEEGKARVVSVVY